MPPHSKIEKPHSTIKRMASTEKVKAVDQPIVWRNVMLFTLLHLGALYGLYLLLTAQAKFYTYVCVYVLHFLGGAGITAGAHRLWSHKTYKASLPLRLFLVICNSIALQNDIIEWSRDHRVHHKYTETDADPHNAKRGFFFSHVGWLMMRKHSDVKEKGRNIDMSDLHADPLLRFQKKYYVPVAIFSCFVFPTILPSLWGESYVVAYFTTGLFRYCLTLHSTWAVNSFAHMYGNKPYDKHINPAQNVSVAVMAMGEGWHNYHHTFPFDYRTSEYPWHINFTTVLIDAWCWLGLASDRKLVSKPMVLQRKLKTGDGTDLPVNDQQ